MQTAQLISSCSVCHKRHISITHKSYLTHYTALPFNCEHGHRIQDMVMVEQDSRTKPFINLPADIRRLAPECLSESSGGQITNDKLDADKQRLQEAFDKAEEAFQALSLLVATSGVSTQSYPQYSTDHVNYLLAAMESNVDECIGYIDAQKENIHQLAEVDEADSLRISDQGDISIASPNAGVQLQQLDLGIGESPMVMDFLSLQQKHNQLKLMCPCRISWILKTWKLRHYKHQAVVHPWSQLPETLAALVTTGKQ